MAETGRAVILEVVVNVVADRGGNGWRVKQGTNVDGGDIYG